MGFLERQASHQAASRSKQRLRARKQYEEWTHTPHTTTRRGRVQMTSRPSHTRAKQLETAPNKITCTPDTIAHTLGSLRTTRATSLDLTRCGVGERTASRLAEALRVNSSITALNLSRNQMSSMSVSELLLALQGQLIRRNGGVKYLNLSHNTIGSLLRANTPAITALRDLLIRPDCQLQRLSLVATNLHSPQVNLIAEALHHNPALTSLDLRSNKTGAAGVRALGLACSQDGCKLKSLHIGQNQLDDTAIAEFVPLFESGKSSLQTLNVSSNIICDESIGYVAKALSKDFTLTCLSLSDNRVGARGAAALATLLDCHQTLKELNLSDNPLGDSGVIAMSRSLVKLDKLRVSGCGMQEPGAIAIASVLATTNCEVELGRNQVGVRARRVLQSVVDRRCWSWWKERVLWCGYHGKIGEGFSGLPPEVMQRVVAHCRGDGNPQPSRNLRVDLRVDSYPVVVDFGELEYKSCALGIHRDSNCNCKPPKLEVNM